jgi:hypothetical protein
MKSNVLFIACALLLCRNMQLAAQTRKDVKDAVELKLANNDSSSVFHAKSFIRAYTEMAKEQVNLIKKRNALLDFLNFQFQMMTLTYKTKLVRDELTTIYQNELGELPPSVIYSRATNEAYAKIEKNYSKQVDSIEHLHNRFVEQLYMQHKYNAVRYFPTTSHGVMTKLYYNSTREKKVEFLRSANLFFGDDRGSFTSELLAGYFGLSRISINSVLSREKKKEINPAQLDTLTEMQLNKLIIQTDSVNNANATFNKIISGGGEIFLQSQIPLLNINGNRRHRVFFESEFVAKMSFDVPLAGSELNASESNTFGMGTINNRLLFPIENYNDKMEGIEGFYIYATLNPSMLYGNKQFYTNLGLAERKAFYVVDYSVGITFKNYMLYFNNQWFSMEKLRDSVKPRIGITMVRNLNSPND